MASLTYTDYLKASKNLHCEVAAIRAVTDVESSGSGFYLTGGIKKRFEAHLFLRETGVSAGSFEAAFAVNQTAALKSTSWGKFQVLGSNFAAAGYSSPANMVEAYKKSEQVQLDSFVLIIKAWGLMDELQNHRWDAFAYKYNGPKYDSSYPANMERYYQKYKIDPQQQLVFGYSQNNTIGFIVLVFAFAGVGFYSYKKGYVKTFFKSVQSIKLPQLPKLL